MSEVVGGPLSNDTDSLFRRVVDASPDLLWILDPEGVVLRVNGAQEAVLGYPSGELNGRPLLQLVHPDDPLLRSEIERVGRGSRGAFRRPLPTFALRTGCGRLSPRGAGRFSTTRGESSQSSRRHET